MSQVIRGAHGVSAATYDYLRGNARSISVGGFSYQGSDILKVGDASTQKVWLDAVTASWFTTMGVKPFIGRTLGADANRPGGPREVVLGYRFRQNAMHGDPHVVDKTLMLDAAPHTVVGGFLLARALSGLITGASTGTAIAYIAAALVMALAALGATAIPALRARRVNLLSLLRPQ